MTKNKSYSSILLETPRKKKQIDEKDIEPIKIDLPEIINKKYNVKLREFEITERNYVYKKVDLSKIKNTLNKLTKMVDNYSDWLMVLFC